MVVHGKNGTNGKIGGTIGATNGTNGKIGGTNGTNVGKKWYEW